MTEDGEMMVCMYTWFMFESRRSYSSRTSCSRGVMDDEEVGWDRVRRGFRGSWIVSLSSWRRESSAIFGAGSWILWILVVFGGF
jgi:hypothetical protein